MDLGLPGVYLKTTPNEHLWIFRRFGYVSVSLFLSVCSFVVYFFICLFARLRVSGFFLGENSIDGSMFEGFPPVPVHGFPESLTGIY